MVKILPENLHELIDHPSHRSASLLSHSAMESGVALEVMSSQGQESAGVQSPAAHHLAM